MGGMVMTSSTADRVLSPFEVAALDIQGKLAGVPVSDLLGGAVRDRVSYTAYLFYKWAGHPGQDDDSWGAALDPEGIVRQARRIVDEYGFTAIKLKGGVFHPDEEVAAIKALRAGVPGPPAAPRPEHRVDRADLDQGRRRSSTAIVEYLEDPTAGIEGMAAVAREASMPLATNMAVVSFDHLPPAIAQDAVQVILSDHHFWGGLRRSQTLGTIAQTWGIGLSMHSNSHLGISLAAMTHLAAATPNLDYACDTHWPWKSADEDVDRGRRHRVRRRCGRGADRAGPRRRAGPRPAGPAARAVPLLRSPQPRRHRLHAPLPARLRRLVAALVSALRVLVTEPIMGRFEERADP